MQTPAGRAAGLGRPVPPPSGGFGPPGSGDTGYGGMPDGSYDSYTDDDFAKPRGGRRWLKRSVYIVLALAVIGGGLYGGYRWTQTQYYVGAKDGHVALFQGISQDLAWVSLSKVEKNHPEIELKYLPPYQRKRVESTIAEGNITDAREKIAELAAQASACKKDAQRRAAEAETRARTGEGEAGGTAGAPATRTSATSSAKGTKQTTAPTPGPSLSEEEKKLVPQCGKQ